MSIVFGATRYNKMKLDGVDVAVLEGKTLDDLEFVYTIKLDQKSGHNYFVSRATKEKSWVLPEYPSQKPQSERPIRQRVEAFYRKYNPGKMKQVDLQLTKYTGQEDALIKALEERYGPEPKEEEQQPAAPVRAEAEAEQKKVTEPQSDSAVQPDKKTEQPSSEGLKQTFFFDVPAADPLTTAATASSQEHLLANFVSDRENRLEELRKKYDQSVEVIEGLQAANYRLSQETVLARAQKEKELKDIADQCDTLLKEKQAAMEQWEVEKQALEAKVDAARTSVLRTANAEKIQLQEERSKFLEEIFQLQQQLQEAKSKLQSAQAQTTELLRILEKRDDDLRSLQMRVEEARLNAKEKPSASMETQTPEPGENLSDIENRVLFNVHSPFSSPHRRDAKKCARCANTANVHCASCRVALCLSCDKAIHQQSKKFAEHRRRKLQLDSGPTDTRDLMLEFESLVLDEAKRQEELESWKHKAKVLQEEIRSLQQALLRKGPQSCPNCEATSKTVVALKKKRAELEQQVAQLELALVAQPQGDTDVHYKVQEEAEQLSRQLLDAKVCIRQQKQEISDLRGLLSIHMSSPR